MKGLPPTPVPKLVISRYWKNPEISILVTSEAISLEMTLDDFLDALAIEIGNPTLLVTVAGLKAKAQKAAQVVCEHVKETSKQVV